MPRLIAIYMRVSSRQQDTRSQEPDLRRWAEAYADAPVKWYTDKFTGKTITPSRVGIVALHNGLLRSALLDSLDCYPRNSRKCTRAEKNRRVGPDLSNPSAMKTIKVPRTALCRGPRR